MAALKALSRAQSIAPEDWTCSFFIGDVHRQMGQYGPAVETLEKILEDRPDETGVLVSLAESYLALGRSEFATGFMTRSDTSFASSVTVSLRIIRGSPGFRSIAWKTVADALYELSKTAIFANEDVVRQAVLPLSDILTRDGSGSVTQAKLGGVTVLSDVLSRLHAEGVSGSTILWLAVAAYQYRVELLSDGGDADVKAAALFDLAVALHSSLTKLSSPSEEQHIVIQYASDALKQALKEAPSNEMFWNALGTLKFDSDLKLAQHSYIKALEIDAKVTSFCSRIVVVFLPDIIAYHALERCALD